MEIASSYPIDVWGSVFKEFHQVEGVRVDYLAERLDVTVKGREGILHFSSEELDDYLYKFEGNPKEVVTYYLKENGVIVYYQDTLVGFFDILGYSSFLDKVPIEKAIRETSNFIKDIRSSAKADILGVKIDCWILSDAVIIVVDTNRHSLFSGSLEVFLGTCSNIMYKGMVKSFPLRGAIGGGNFYKDGEVLVSSALVDAVKYEKEQEWLGSVLTPNAITMIEEAKKLKNRNPIDFASARFKDFIRHGTIPWKDEANHADAYYIKPFKMADVKWAEKYLPAYFDNKRMIENSHVLYAQE